ncbi:MAG: helix-turn-helix domain-containing protein [Pseudomonadota bacterium]
MKPKNQVAARRSGKVERDDHVFKALANTDRRRILDALRKGPLNTGEICALLPKLDRCTVMLHLRVLDQSELIIVKREGRCRWNYLNIAPIQGIYSRWIKDFAAPSAAALHRLKVTMEK